jgi:dTDP-4-dehydrorhamnose reductase
MPARTTLLIGASGQVGRALASVFPSEGLVKASHRHAKKDDLRLDLAEESTIQSVLGHVRPDLILLAGAMCNAEQCEVEPGLCERINTTGPAVLAAYARDHGARLVFFSTDHVFDGKKDTYVEDDRPNPLYVYARSKAQAEVRIRELLPDRHVIVRTGWVYGPDAERRNFALRLIDRIAAGETVTVPSDQFGSPTCTDDLARATHHLVARGAVGTFHATGPDFLDRGTLALQICDAFGLERDAVVTRPTRELGQVARRSLRVRLDCGKLRRTGAPPFRGVAEGLRSLADDPLATVADSNGLSCR